MRYRPAHVAGFPIYAQFGWGLGVWGGLIGSILLLLRSRYAVHAFGVSLVGMVLSFGYQFLGAAPLPAMTSGAMTLVPVLIILVGIALFFYARSQGAKGVLR